MFWCCGLRFAHDTLRMLFEWLGRTLFSRSALLDSFRCDSLFVGIKAFLPRSFIGNSSCVWSALWGEKLLIFLRKKEVNFTIEDLDMVVSILSLFEKPTFLLQSLYQLSVKVVSIVTISVSFVLKRPLRT